MIWDRLKFESIYLYRHPVDMRKSIDGLSSLMASMEFDLTEPSLFVFTNRGRDKVKLLLWEHNGFWLLYKRLVKQRFHWPDWFQDDTLVLEEKQVDQLLQGFNLNGMRPHDQVFLAHSF